MALGLPLFGRGTRLFAPAKNNAACNWPKLAPAPPRAIAQRAAPRTPTYLVLSLALALVS